MSSSQKPFVDRGGGGGIRITTSPLPPLMPIRSYTVKKVIDFPVPIRSRDATYQTLLCLVSDKPAGDGENFNHFYSV